MGETLSWYIEKSDMTHSNWLLQETLFPVLGQQQHTAQHFFPSCQSHHTLQSPQTEEEQGIFHLLEELENAALQPSEGGPGFNVAR